MKGPGAKAAVDATFRTPPWLRASMPGRKRQVSAVRAVTFNAIICSW
jgi:hypothetical protein